MACNILDFIRRLNYCKLVMKMKKIVIDLDGTLTIDSPRAYSQKVPNLDVISRLREYRQDGYTISIFTARNMRTYKGDIDKINTYTLPVILEWLKLHDIPFDEVIIGKPWCGEDGFYVDDKSLRPSEFVRLTPSQVKKVLSGEL